MRQNLAQYNHLHMLVKSPNGILMNGFRISCVQFVRAVFHDAAYKTQRTMFEIVRAALFFPLIVQMFVFYTLVFSGWFYPGAASLAAFLFSLLLSPLIFVGRVHSNRIALAVSKLFANSWSLVLQLGLLSLILQRYYEKIHNPWIPNMSAIVLVVIAATILPFVLGIFLVHGCVLPRIMRRSAKIGNAAAINAVRMFDKKHPHKAPEATPPLLEDLLVEFHDSCISQVSIAEYAVRVEDVDGAAELYWRALYAADRIIERTRHQSAPTSNARLWEEVNYLMDVFMLYAEYSAVYCSGAADVLYSKEYIRTSANTLKQLYDQQLATVEILFPHLW